MSLSKLPCRFGQLLPTVQNLLQGSRATCADKHEPEDGCSDRGGNCVTVAGFYAIAA